MKQSVTPIVNTSGTKARRAYRPGQAPARKDDAAAPPGHVAGSASAAGGPVRRRKPSAPALVISAPPGANDAPAKAPARAKFVPKIVAAPTGAPVPASGGDGAAAPALKVYEGSSSSSSSSSSDSDSDDGGVAEQRRRRAAELARKSAAAAAAAAAAEASGAAGEGAVKNEEGSSSGSSSYEYESSSEGDGAGGASSSSSRDEMYAAPAEPIKFVPRAIGAGAVKGPAGNKLVLEARRDQEEEAGLAKLARDELHADLAAERAAAGQARDAEIENELAALDDTDPRPGSAEDLAARAAWAERERHRRRRNRAAKEAARAEAAELARRRKLTDEEVMREDAEKRAGQKPKAKMKFMQKYRHGGAFFRAGDEGDILEGRDVLAATGDDLFDKAALPKPMQVKKDMFGKKGQTKYTHLADQDTTTKESPFYGWGGGGGGGKGAAGGNKKRKR